MTPAATIFDPLPIQAVGARLRAARFPAAPGVPARGVCVLLNGQTEFIEKYFEVIDELRARGFAVATMDWRGQGASTRALSDDSRKSYVHDFSEYEEDLDTLMNWIVTPMLAPGQRPFALAHSMGGHNLLRYLLKRPDSFGPCVLNAPMIGISFRGQRELLVRTVTAFQIRRRNAGGWVWGMEARDPLTSTFATQLVTSDPQRFERTQALLREQPDLRLSGATWGWLAAALRSMDWLKAPGRPESIQTPMLILGAGKDRICITPEAKAFAARMPHATYLEIEGAEHEILMERNLYRAQLWAGFDDFVART
ncbi:MAG TPA: alpha/beta hydrolase [Rhizomicrobium sp.]|jgi:lysophospholipase